MVATFTWCEHNGAGTSLTTSLSNANFGNIDGANIDITVEANKIPRGSFSYDKYVFGSFSGTFTQIGPNAKVWKSAGVLPGGATILAGTTVTYAAPSQSSCGYSAIPTSYATGLAITFGSSIPAATGSSSTFNPSLSCYYRSQLATAGTAATGTISPQTISLQYDES